MNTIKSINFNKYYQLDNSHPDYKASIPILTPPYFNNHPSNFNLHPKCNFYLLFYSLEIFKTGLRKEATSTFYHPSPLKFKNDHLFNLYLSLLSDQPFALATSTKIFNPLFGSIPGEFFCLKRWSPRFFTEAQSPLFSLLRYLLSKIKFPHQLLYILKATHYLKHIFSYFFLNFCGLLTNKNITQKFAPNNIKKFNPININKFSTNKITT